MTSRPLGTVARNCWSGFVTSTRPVALILGGTGTTRRFGTAGCVAGGPGGVTAGPVAVGFEAGFVTDGFEAVLDGAVDA
jgi:hypothetical protein